MSQAGSNPGTDGSPWRGLYRAGGAAALATAVLIPVQLVVFVIWPPPATDDVEAWFTRFQDSPLLGLLSLDLLLLVDYALLVPVFLALYVVLRRFGRSLMAIALVAGLVGIAAYFPSNPAFEMLSLSDRYAAATTDAERAMYLVAGEAVLASWEGTAFQVSYVLVAVAGVLIPFAMLRSGVFSKATAYTGLVGNVTAFGLFVPFVGVLLALLSVVVLWVWYVLIARRLFELGGEP